MSDIPEHWPRLITLQLPEDEYEALKAFHASPEGAESLALSARRLLRDQLIGMGDLALTDANRGRAAGSKRG
jgi:hypothetical protein